MFCRDSRYLVLSSYCVCICRHAEDLSVIRPEGAVAQHNNRTTTQKSFVRPAQGRILDYRIPKAAYVAALLPIAAAAVAAL